MGDVQNIQWFPGHMTKTKRKIQENLKLVDAVVEIVDARIPKSSRNPDLNSIIGNKPKILVLNKCDMADPVLTTKWANYYSSKGTSTIILDCKSGKGISFFIPKIKNLLRDKIVSYKEKGFINKSLKLMVVGIPNVGKSSFINKMSKEKKAKTEDRPGVTKGNQWFSIGKSVDLLDTPGVLWPKFEDQKVAEKLAFYGSIKDDILDIEELAFRLIDCLKEFYQEILISRYKLDNNVLSFNSYEILKKIAIKRGMIISKGEPDLRRASLMLLDEFRSAKLGKITLDII